jgi:DNA mismatch repair protein MutL
VFQSLREAYAEALPKGRHPLAVLRITMDPLSFDCNVHPAKREVRLHRPDLLRQAVFLAAERAIQKMKSPVASKAPLVSRDAAQIAPPPIRSDDSAIESAPVERPSFEASPQLEMAVTSPQPLSVAGQGPGPEPDDFQLLGGLRGRWILMQGADGLVILDTRAASERILFETLRREAAGGEAASQRLLLPTVVELTAKDAVWISENLEALRAAGFYMEPFGGSSFKVEALPACLAGSDARDAVLGVCETLKATGLLGGGQPVLDVLIRSVARFAALNGFNYEESKARRLVRELLRCELPYACPQGRPTMIQWSFAELERKFGR